MRNACPYLLCLTLLGLVPAAVANTVQRCEDTLGNITFTTLGCATDQSSETRHVTSPRPGSVTPLLPKAQPPERPGRDRADKELVVVGQRDDGCGNRLSTDQRRQAIINQRTPPGMTKRDVESLLGRPDKISNNNGELRYEYNQKKGRSNTVTFDANGCVKGKR